MRLLLALLALPAFAQVAVDNSSIAFLDSGTTLTFSHTTGSGSNRAMAVGCTVAAGSGTAMPNISTVTYASVSLSQLAKRDANYDTYIWTLPNGTQPTTGANNVVVTLASALTGTSPTLTCGAITYTGVDQTNAWTVSDCTGAGSSGNATCTLGASGANDMLFVTACHGTELTTVGSGLTLRQNIDSSLNACGSLGVATGTGGTTSVTWNVTGTDSWQILAGALKAAGGAATPVVPRRIFRMGF